MRRFVLGLLAVVHFVAGGVCAAQTPESGRFGAFVTVDPASNLFRDETGIFAAISVVYVQPNLTGVAEPGYNSGQIQVALFDLTRFRDDFRHMRRTGVRAIYMRIGAGLFFNRDGSWRKITDPLGVGSFDPAQTDAEIRANLKKAVESGIGPFEYSREIFDYLLDCAEAEGIRVIPMIMDNWSVPRKYDLQEKLTSILDQDVWSATIADWVRIADYLQDRKAVLGYLVEGETLNLPVWHEEQWSFLGEDGPKVELARSPIEDRDPRLTLMFQDHLRGRYGSIQALKKRWRHGYNRSKMAYSGPYDTPFYPFEKGMFSHLSGFHEIGLPTVERAKGTEDTIGPGDKFPWWLNIPFDPVWTEFAYFKDALFIQKMNTLFAALRKADPNHLLIVSSALDSVAVWHPFFTPWNKGALDCDVLLHGGGYANALKKEPVAFTPQETALELYQSVGLCRPFAQASGRAFGMGEGGLDFESNNPKSKEIPVSETLQERWIAALLTDNFGSGAALANIWDWGSVTGPTVANPKSHDHEVTQTMRRLGEALDVGAFPGDRRADTLILANGPTVHSLMKPLAWNNIVCLSTMLAWAGVPFDIVTTDDVGMGAMDGKVDLAAYRRILMPQLFQIPSGSLSGATVDGSEPSIWAILDEWLAETNGHLVVGAASLRDAWFNPLDALPADMRKVVGDVEIGSLERLTGEKEWRTAEGVCVSVGLDQVFCHDVRLTGSGVGTPKPFLLDGERVLGVRRALANGGSVTFVGVPLGLSWMHLRDPALSGGGINAQITPQNRSWIDALLQIRKRAAQEPSPAFKRYGELVESGSLGE